MAPHHNSKSKQILALLPIAAADLVIGLGYGWAAPTIKYLLSTDNDFHLTVDEVSWIAALPELGKLSSPLLAGILVDKLGRKMLLINSAMMLIIVWSSILITRSVVVLYMARYLFGLANGIFDLAACIYIGEMAHPSIRGTFLTAINTMFFSGILCSFVCGTYLSYDGFACVILVFSVIYFLLCYFLVETPQYLIVKDNYALAKANLSLLRGGGEANEIESELEEMRNHIREEKLNRPNFRKAITDPVNVKIFLLVMSICTMGPMSGYSAIVYYASVIFRADGFMTTNQFTILYGVMQLLTSVLSSFLIDKCGRRFLLFTFAGLSAALHALTASLYFAQKALPVQIEHFTWMIFVTITSYSALYTFGFLPVNFTLRSELFPQDLKGFGGSLAVIGHAGVSFLCSKTFLGIANLYGTYVNFILYAVASVITFTIVFFYLPETKGKTLVEIQRHFRNGR